MILLDSKRKLKQKIPFVALLESLWNSPVGLGFAEQRCYYLN